MRDKQTCHFIEVYDTTYKILLPEKNKSNFGYNYQLDRPLDLATNLQYLQEIQEHVE